MKNLPSKIQLDLLAIVTLLILAIALRAHALDGRPLWWDEGLTLTYAFLPPLANLELARTTEHLNPPLYNWLVGLVTSLTGVTVFTARLASVYGGLLTAAAFYTLIRLAFSRMVATVALLLLAISPVQIYFAQEAKGYTVEAAALFVAMLCWWRLHRWAIPGNGDKRAPTLAAAWPWWLGVGLAILLAMGANYLALFALLTANLFTLAVTVQARQRGMSQRELLAHWRRWLAVQIVALLPLLPYVATTIYDLIRGLENTSVDLEMLTPGGYLWFFLSNFVSGQRPPGTTGFLLTLTILVLAAAGLLWPWPQKWPAGRWLLAVWFFLPLAAGYFFQLRFAWFFPRHLLYIQPVLLALAAVALVQLLASRRLLSGGALAAVLLLTAPTLYRHYQAPPNFAEDADWPLLFAQMQPYVREGDIVIARTSWIPGYMAAYWPAATPPDWLLGYFDETDLEETLPQLLAGYERVWQIDYQISPLDPENDSAVWMRGEAALAHFDQVGTASAALFVDGCSLEATWPNEETMVTAFVNGVHVRWSPATAVAQPGDVVGTMLTWWTVVPLDSHLVRFLHILAEDGALLAQIDREPVLGSSRSYEWEVGEAIPDPLAIALPADSPTGTYAIRLGLYDRQTLQRVTLSEGGDSLLIGWLEIH